MSATSKSPKPLNTPNPNMTNGTPNTPLKKTVAKTSPSAAKKDTAATQDQSATATAQEDVVKAIEKLEIKSKAINLNNIARVANSWLNSKDEQLHTLYSLKTGRVLEKFPGTSAGIAKLSLPVVDSMLNHLDADRSGNEEAKKEKLRLQLGLRPTPA